MQMSARRFLLNVSPPARELRKHRVDLLPLACAGVRSQSLYLTSACCGDDSSSAAAYISHTHCKEIELASLRRLNRKFIAAG